MAKKHHGFKKKKGDHEMHSMHEAGGEAEGMKGAGRKSKRAGKRGAKRAGSKKGMRKAGRKGRR